MNPTDKPSTPESVCNALHAGKPIQWPPGATAVKVMTESGRVAMVLKGDEDTLRNCGPYKAVWFGVLGKGRKLIPVRRITPSRGVVARP